MSDYSFGMKIRTFFDLVSTKFFYKHARLVRKPIYVRGKKGWRYGKGLTTGRGCRIEASNQKTTLLIGADARIGDYVHICAEENVSIGDNVLIASKVFISDTSHGIYAGDNPSEPFTNPTEREHVCKPVIIGNNVWIGENVVILSGTTIGDGCIVGANAVLTGKNYPDNSIIVGVPGRIIKRFDFATKKWIKYDE